jgi:hypothetical protein
LTGLLFSALVPDVSIGYWDYQALANYRLTAADTLSVFAFGSHDYLGDTTDPSRPVEVLDLTFHRSRIEYHKAVSPATLLGTSVFAGLSRTGGGGDRDRSDSVDVVGQMLGARATVEHQFAEALSLQIGADSYWWRNEFEFGQNTHFGPAGQEIEAGASSPAPVLTEPPLMGEMSVNAPSGESEPNAPIEPIVFEGNPASRLPEAEFPPQSAGARPWFPTEAMDSQQFAREQYSSRDDVLSGVWLELGWWLSNRVHIKPALRFDSFLTGSTWDYAIDPRITARYRLTDALTMIHTLGTAHQGPSFVVPVPGLNPKLTGQLQRAIQSSAAAELSLPKAVFASVTGFQNVTLNASDVLSASRFTTITNDTNPFIDRTTAHSYGVEFMLRRSLSESFGGFFAYTLSRSIRSSERVDGVSSFDRTHVINLAAAYDLGRNWRVGARLVTYSGLPATVGTIRAFANPPRTSWFYRIDWRLEKRWALNDSGSSLALVAEVVNTTLNQEALSASCYAYGCTEEKFGPVTLPSLGVEGAL